mmetsp:Transcript_41074/g.99004  ORF Transcript_41074/g.99004 Transcript_41074/m.99004 type:complete len:124 (+) Transcript_41074:638-1009(+)|eukprot:CAMPEP_0113651050 /NCGR_PEP_ID=MMETSP0017_2-20120614/27200_1 /TAXON_ID=2856 /ORGANISM="Cylindrotheca closterium" /LENGTH=123 /DNA_ID=CAMNT_0000563673 /DNA_START=48 /DNA_END=419 /DNA_ORIENTATION=+ /assembly_acc=CAM_ASM_000147
MNPSKSDVYNGNYPNNAEGTSPSHQRLNDSQNRTGIQSGAQHESAIYYFQQSLRVPTPPAFLSSMTLPRQHVTETLSVEQERKRTIDILDEALDMINGKFDDDEAGEELLFINSCLSNSFPKQ